MRKEKGGKRGRKKMDDMEKESQVEERSEVITEEGTERREEEEIEEGPAIVRLYKLCLAWGLSVCPSLQVMFGMGFVRL